MSAHHDEQQELENAKYLWNNGGKSLCSSGKCGFQKKTAASKAHVCITDLTSFCAINLTCSCKLQKRGTELLSVLAFYFLFF